MRGSVTDVRTYFIEQALKQQRKELGLTDKSEGSDESGPQAAEPAA